MNGIDAADPSLARSQLIGRSLPRFEDVRLLRGAGRYTDDITLPEEAFAVFVRAPHAHARLLAIDFEAARRLPGVLAVLTGRDYLADGHGGISHSPNPADALDIGARSFIASAERAILDVPQVPLAVERVRYVGEAVAVVVAHSRLAALDAAEAVQVKYDPLPAVSDVAVALAPDALQIWHEAPGNVALDNSFG